MRAAGLKGVQKRRYVRTTVSDPSERWAPDLVDRKFTVRRANRLWVADLTYIATWAGFLYVAVVIDAFSRRVIGWAMETHLRTELVLAALEMAYTQRAPCQKVIFHSDHGTQYTSVAFGQRCDELGVRPSMGSVGDAYDNALAESFFASLECEVLDRNHFRTRERKPVRRSSHGSRDGTTRIVVIRPWGISRQNSLNMNSLRNSSPEGRSFCAFASDRTACKTNEGNEDKDKTSKQKEDIRQSRNPLTKDRPLNRGRSIYTEMRSPARGSQAGRSGIERAGGQIYARSRANSGHWHAELTYRKPVIHNLW